MKKQYISITVILVMLMSLFPSAVPIGADDYEYIYLSANEFEVNLGGWTIQENYDATLNNKNLLGSTAGKPDETAPATISIKINNGGKYTVWARTKDFEERPGVRNFQISLNNQRLPYVFGKSGIVGWAWENGGKAALSSGNVTVSLVDTSGTYARVDAVILTNDPSFKPDNELAKINEGYEKYKTSAKSGSADLAAPTDETGVPASSGTTTYNSDKEYLFISAAEIESIDLGTWSIAQNYENTLNNKIILGATDGAKNAVRPAVLSVNIKQTDDYYVWARTRDFSEKQGTRLFSIDLNYQTTGKRFGAHGVNGWAWEVSNSVKLGEGSNDVVITDLTASYARCELVILTNDENFQPPSDLESMKSGYETYKASVKPSIGPRATPRPLLREKPEGAISVMINGAEVDFDVLPQIHNGRTLVPMRKIFETIGAVINWDDNTNTVTARKDDTVISLTIGFEQAFIDGVMSMLDQEPIVIDGRTLVPVRFISEALGADVEWLDDIKLVRITLADSNAVFLRPSSFSQLGVWSFESNSVGAFNATNLRGSIPSVADQPNPVGLEPAVAYFNLDKGGEYRVWVRARDYAANQPGTRFFSVSVNGKQLDKSFGRHGRDGFAWEDAGRVSIEAGEVRFELVDTSNFYARCDAVLITSNLNFVPPENYEAVMEIAQPIKQKRPELEFPTYARTAGQPKSQMDIQNGNVKVTFFEVDSNGKNVIQRETEVMHNGQWTAVDSRRDGLGYMLIYADKSVNGGLSAQYPVFEQTLDGRTYKTPIIFDSGRVMWMVPNRIERIDDRTIALFADNDYGAIRAVWKLNNDCNEPVVNVEFTAAKAGAYSIGMFNYMESSKSDVEFAHVPFKIHSQRFPDDALLINEQYAFSPVSTTTFDESKSRVKGEKVTYGVTVDPSSIPKNRWVYSENSRFGMNVVGPNGGAYPGVFAPLFGNEESTFAQGQTFEFSYRPVTKIGGWFDAYRHIAVNIFKLTDYRTNYYTSLTEATFNTRQLMMDDKFSGWDIYSKEHYNMEGRNYVSQANPLQAMQSYLFTEDKDLLTRRTIPTMASLLTRNSLHFSRREEHEGSVHYFADEISDMGNPIRGFNTSSFGSAYLLSRGLVPKFNSIALDDGVRYTNAYGSIPEFSEYLWTYNFTKDKEYLKIAMDKADEYIRVNITEPQTATVGHSSFIYISYYPHLPSLIDIYEVTGEERYLDAAIETAYRLVSTLWLPGLTDVSRDEMVTIKAEDVKNYNYGDNNTHFWWNGNIQWRLGSEPGVLGKSQNVDILEDETVPSWLPSRVGIGIEQASTFSRSYNIIMSNFAGDLLRLSKHANDKLFEVYARNAIIGRFSNYPGYYQGALLVHQMKPDYPYVGPDYTSIYYHHIPTFLSMLEDFLISQAWLWSDEKIDFPNVRMQGYAFFNNRQYGFEAGRFFDEDNIWLWLQEDIMKTDSIQIDWIAARKDGTLALALMNQDFDDITTTIKLGSAVEGGESYNGQAVLYNADGSKSSINVTDGEFSVHVPSHKLVGVVLKIDGVKAPEYSKISVDSLRSKGIANTVTDHENGKGMVLQVSGENYYAYTYITQKPDKVSKAVLNYKIGSGQPQKMETDVYPYEFIVEVDDVTQSFTYSIDIYNNNGQVEKTTEKTLKPIK